MRPLIDLAYRLRRRAMALVGWRTRGVKVMAFDASGRVLLVRHRYGRSDLWMLPGGGIARGEAPIAAALRELMEETGCRWMRPRSSDDGTRAPRDGAIRYGSSVARPPTRHRSMASNSPRRASSPPDALPAAASPATRRRVDELLGRSVSDGRW